MRVAVQGKIAEIGQRRTAALFVDLAERGVSADDLRHLDVEQVRRVHCLPVVEQPPLYRPGRWRPQQCFKERRGVN